MSRKGNARVQISAPNRQCRQEGAALVEFAFILPPLLLLTVGTLLYGLVFVTQQTMAFAAQRGAAAIVQVDPAPYAVHGTVQNVSGYCSAGASLVEARVEGVLPDVGLFSHTTSVQAVTPSSGAALKGCEVTVTSDFPLNIPLLPLPDEISGVGFVPLS